MTEMPLWFSIKGRGESDFTEFGSLLYNIGLGVHPTIVFSMMQLHFRPYSTFVFVDNLYTSHALQCKLLINIVVQCDQECFLNV